MIKSCFHVHTNWCDGKSTIEEMIESAIKKGFTHLGFSGHSFLENAEKYSLTPDRLDKYVKEVETAKVKYADKLKIFLGIEQDYFSKPASYPFEFCIGSVHNIEKNGKLLFFDISKEETERIIREVYDGKYVLFAKDYFETISNVVDVTGADIIGHIDLCSKYNEKLGNSQTEEYLEYAEKAVDKLVKTGAIFEINTGAMARGHKTSPYPSVEILKMIYSRGGKIMINSDCHNHEQLDFAFPEAQALARKVGFTKYYIFNGQNFTSINFED